MAKYLGGVTLSGYASPSDTADIYATHKAQFGYGGYRSALDIAARDNITELRREEGMVVYVISEKKEYRLVGGILNSNWEEVVFGISTGSGNNNYIIISTFGELPNIPRAERRIGLLVYIADIDMEYRLVDGIEDSNWVEVSLQNGYIIVQRLEDLQLIPEAKRKNGLMVYVVETKSEYRLEDGILDSNWVHVTTKNSVGNYIIVNTIIERDQIELSIRKIGLICYVKTLDNEYRLVNGIDNQYWVLLNNTVSTGNCKYIIVNTLEDISNLPLGEREIGLTLYAKNVDREFRFVNGITNTDLKELLYSSGATSGGSGGINNNYYNTFGCLNKALIMEAIIDEVANYNPIYTDSTGTIVPSLLDINAFDFRINGTDYWAEDWIPFSGSTKITSGVVSEVFLEITQTGVTEIINITNTLLTGVTLNNMVITGNNSSWGGYFKRSSTGRIDIKAYQIDNNTQLSNINKSVYLFAPNFAIKDGTTNTPNNIILTGGIYPNKEYDIEVISNSILTFCLARINVNSRGIDTQNYTNITSTMATITNNGKYIIPGSTFSNIVSGNYAIVVTGKDGGVVIPTYFYGPFIINV